MAAMQHAATDSNIAETNRQATAMTEKNKLNQPTILQRAFLPYQRNQGPWEPVVSQAQHLTQSMQTLLQQFWNCELDLKFIGVGARLTDEFLQGEPAFIIDYPDNLDNETPRVLSVHMTEDCYDWLLSHALGSTPPTAHRLSTELSEIEDTLLEAFYQQWVNAILHQFGSTEGNTVLKDQPPIDFLWTLYDPDSEHSLGKVVIQVPADILRQWLKQQPRPSLQPHPEPTVSEDLYQHAKLSTVIGLGISRVNINDLKRLELDDVMILEDSDVDFMTIKDPYTHREFDVEVQFPDWVEHQCRIHVNMPHHPSSTQQPQDKRPMNTSYPSSSNDMHDAFWNQLLIDVRAEFLPIRIPLNELKQLSEGLIMEVGDLANNSIRLHIDDKTIAEGELVIVGDKFGVRIKSIEEEHDNENDDEAVGQHRPMITPIDVEDDDNDNNDDNDNDDGHDADDNVGMPIEQSEPKHPEQHATEEGMPIEKDNPEGNDDKTGETNENDDDLFDEEDDW